MKTLYIYREREKDRKLKIDIVLHLIFLLGYVGFLKFLRENAKEIK